MVSYPSILFAVIAIGNIYDIRIAYAKDIIRFRSMLGKVTMTGRNLDKSL